MGAGAELAQGCRRIAANQWVGVLKRPAQRRHGRGTLLGAQPAQGPGGVLPHTGLSIGQCFFQGFANRISGVILVGSCLMAQLAQRHGRTGLDERVAVVSQHVD